MFKKWESIFFSTNADEYYYIKGKLINAGLKHKSKVESSNNNRGGHINSRSYPLVATYEIFVTEQDIGKANAIINSK